MAPSSIKLRVGLIGLGEAWETRHKPALRALSDRFEVRAVCCEVAKKAEHVAREFSADAVDGFRAMIAREDIDAILSLAPDWFGALPILAACEKEKAIYSSAALDIEPEQAVEIKQRVDRAGIAFMAEFPRRHAPATLRLKELIATSLGRPRLLFCHQRWSIEDRFEPRRRGSHCPVVMREAMELVDWCRYVVGHDPSFVTCNRHEHLTCENLADYQVISLGFPDLVMPSTQALTGGKGMLPSVGGKTPVSSSLTKGSDQGTSSKLLQGQKSETIHSSEAKFEPVSDETRYDEAVGAHGAKGNGSNGNSHSGTGAWADPSLLEDLPEVTGGGVLAQISIGHYIPSRWKEALNFRRPASLQVVCENGVAFLDLPNSLVWFDDAGQHMESLETDRPVGEQLLTHFHRAVTSLIRKTSDLEDTYRALTIVMNATRSRMEGRRMPLSF